MVSLNFTTREQYLTWRAEWRIEYAAISALIRKFKARRANLMRSGDDAAAVQTLVRHQSCMAFEMMEARTESKKMAREQYTTRIQNLSIAA